MAVLPPAAFIDKWANPRTGRFAYNDWEKIDDAAFREFTQDLADSFAASPNRQPGLLKAFAALTIAELAGNGNTGEAFEQLDHATCCLETRLIIGFYRPDPAKPGRSNVELVAVYEPDPAKRTGYVFVDGSFKPGQQTLPVRWVEASDPLALVANVPLLDPARTNYPQGELVRVVLNAKNYLFAAVEPGGPFPAPLDYTGTPDWEPVAETLPPSVRSSACDLGYVRAVMLPTGGVEAGVLYRLTGQWNGGATIETVEVEGGQGGFAAQGTLVAGSTRRAVQVDVAAGTYHAFSSQFADLLGQPGDNAALATALHQLSNDTLTQAQRIDAVLQALAPLQADPTTKSYVDGLIQTITNIDANQAAAIQQLQQHLASDDNLLTGLLSTQATHTQQIMGLQAAGGRYRGTWQANIAYQALDEVIRPDGLARVAAKQAFTSGSSYADANWTVVDAVLTLSQVNNLQNTFKSRGVFAANTTYYPFDFITYLGVPYYRAGAQFTSGSSFVLTDWAVFGVSRYNMPDYANEVLLADGDSAGQSGKSYVLQATTTVSVLLLSSAASIGRIYGFRNPSAGPATIAAASGNTINGSSSLSVAPGEIYWLRVKEDFTYEIVLHNAVGGSPGGTSTSIDYANEQAVSSPTTATIYKAYVLSGNSFTLTLPDAAPVGAALFVRIDDTATSLYTVALADGTEVGRYWGRESVTFRKLGQGWRRQAPDGRPMVARIETALSQQDSLPQNTWYPIPFSRPTQVQGPAGLVELASRGVRLLRDATVSITGNGALQNVTINGQYYFAIWATLPDGTRRAYSPNYAGTAIGVYFGTVSIAATATLPAGTLLTFEVYAGHPANLLGSTDGNQFVLNVTEIRQ